MSSILLRSALDPTLLAQSMGVRLFDEDFARPGGVLGASRMSEAEWIARDPFAEVIAPLARPEMQRPGDSLPVIYSLAGQPFLRPMRWGFTPSWATDDAKHLRPVPWLTPAKARDRAAYREAFRRRRCLVPVRAAFANRGAALNSGLVLRSAARVTQPDFALMPGIWDCWTNLRGDRVLNFALIAERIEDSGDVHARQSSASGSWRPLHFRNLAQQALWLAPGTSSVELGACLDQAARFDLSRGGNLESFLVTASGSAMASELGAQKAG